MATRPQPPGVIAELALAPATLSTPLPIGARAAFVFPHLRDLYTAMDRVYKLGVSLPNAPLANFEAATAKLPSTTEAERLGIVRVGQDLFRAALMEYWSARCPLTDITDPALLRASHIVAWAECDSDAHRLDVHNGLLLSSLWDAAFDVGLLSFTDEGRVLHSPHLSPAAASALRLGIATPLKGLTPAHASNLVRHRAKYGFQVNFQLPIQYPTIHFQE